MTSLWRHSRLTYAMTWDLIFSLCVEFLPGEICKFRVVICFSVGNILGNRVWAVSHPPPPTGHGLMLKGRVNKLTTLNDQLITQLLLDNFFPRIIHILKFVNPRPTGGGAISSPPSRFLAISSKPMQVSPPNLQYPLFQHCYTLC